MKITSSSPQENIILHFAERNRGVVLAKQTKELNISNEILSRMVEKGLMEKPERGVYTLPGVVDDSLYYLQATTPKVVYSHNTALYYHELSDRFPMEISLSIPREYASKKLREGKYQIFYVNKRSYSIAIVEKQSELGNPLKMYNMDKTMCDIVKGAKRMDPDIVKVAFQRYIKRKDKNINQLMIFAEQLKVFKPIYAKITTLL